MTTPNTNVTFSSIQAEFGGSNPIGLNEYYAGGGYVAPGVVGVPTSSTISVNDLRNKTQIVYGVLTPSITSAAENGLSTVTFTLSGTSGIPDGSTLYWRLSGTNITASDFTGASLTGSFTVTAGAGSFAVTPIGDILIEGTESFTALVGTSSGVPVSYVSSVSVNITETQTWSLVWNAWSGYVTEGDTKTIKLSTYNVPADATQYYYVIVPSGAYPIEASGDISPMSGVLGALTIIPGTAQAETPYSSTITFSNDFAYESPGFETFQISIRAGSTSGTEVLNSGNITLFDSPFYSLTWSPSSVSEGSYPTLTLNTYNVPASETYYYTLSGTATSADMPGIFSGTTITTSSNTSSVQHGITYDGSSEGTETLQVTLRSGSTSGTILTTSNILNISDATGSITAANSTGWGYTTPINIYVQITNISPNVAGRYFEVWGNYGSGLYRVTYPTPSDPVFVYVAPGAASSAITQVYYAASATAGVSYYIELRLVGHNTYYMGPFNGYI